MAEVGDMEGDSTTFSSIRTCVSNVALLIGTGHIKIQSV
jgi:hypothetical protein